MKYFYIVFCLFLSLSVEVQAQVSKKYGVVNLEGEVLVPFIYEEITPFENGYARTMRRERYGLIDISGKEIIPAQQYHDMGKVDAGMVIVMRNKLYGVIDTENRILVPLEYKNILPLANNHFLVYKTITSGVVNSNGELTVPLSNSILMPFSGDRNYLLSNDMYRRQSKVIDIENREVTFEQNSGIRDFGNGYLGLRQSKPNTYKVVDIHGKEICSGLTVQENQRFTGDYLRYHDQGKLGLMNIRGEAVLPPVYSRIFDFNNGYAKVVQDSTRFGDNQIGMVDEQGRVIVRCMYDGLGEASDDRIMAFAVQKYGYLDLKGRVAIPFNYDSATDFKDHMAIVSKDNLYGVIDAGGRQVLPFEYRQLRYFGNSLFAASRQLKWGIIDSSGREIIPFIYDSVGEIYNDRYITVQKNQKWGVINLLEYEVLPFIYKSIVDYSDGVFIVTK